MCIQLTNIANIVRTLLMSQLEISYTHVLSMSLCIWLPKRDMSSIKRVSHVASGPKFSSTERLIDGVCVVFAEGNMRYSDLLSSSLVCGVHLVVTNGPNLQLTGDNSLLVYSDSGLLKNIFANANFMLRNSSLELIWTSCVPPCNTSA